MTSIFFGIFLSKHIYNKLLKKDFSEISKKLQRSSRLKITYLFVLLYNKCLNCLSPIYRHAAARCIIFKKARLSISSYSMIIMKSVHKCCVKQRILLTRLLVKQVSRFFEQLLVGKIDINKSSASIFQKKHHVDVSQVYTFLDIILNSDR